MFGCPTLRRAGMMPGMTPTVAAIRFPVLGFQPGSAGCTFLPQDSVSCVSYRQQTKG